MAKKILITFLLILLTASFNTNAADDKTADGGASPTITIDTTENVPGGNCMKNGTLSDGKTPKYTCTVTRGFGTIKATIGELIKFFTYLTGLIGVLYIVVSGMLLSFSGIDPGKKDHAKKNIQKVFFGLIVLLLSGVILNTIAPWVYE